MNMEDTDKKELHKEVKKLLKEKMELNEDLRDLDWAKIIKLEKENEELQKRVEWLDKDKKRLERERENLNRQVSNTRQRRWFSTLKMIMIIGLIDLLILPIIVTVLGIPLQWIFIGIGIVTFFGTVLIVNYMSGTSPLDSGEIRKALTAAVITVYLTFVPLISFGSIQIPAQGAVKTIVENFTWIVGIIVIFYFVTRAVEEYAKIRNKQK
jgi:hypothetical protein